MAGKQVGAASNICVRILATASVAPPGGTISSFVIIACMVNSASLHFSSRVRSMASSTLLMPCFALNRI